MNHLMWKKYFSLVFKALLQRVCWIYLRFIPHEREREEDSQWISSKNNFVDFCEVERLLVFLCSEFVCFVSVKESFGVLGFWDCKKFCLWLWDFVGICCLCENGYNNPYWGFVFLRGFVCVCVRGCNPYRGFTIVSLCLWCL